MVDWSALVMAWLGGGVAGSAIAIGIVQVLTGRAVINPRRIQWSASESKVQGAIFLTYGAIYGAYSLVGPIVIANGMGSRPLPRWFDIVQFVMLFFSAGFGMALLVLEQRHKRGVGREPRLGAPTQQRPDA